MFVTLEDEYGMSNGTSSRLILAAHWRVWRHSPLLAVRARVQRQGPVINCEFAGNSTVALARPPVIDNGTLDHRETLCYDASPWTSFHSPCTG